MDNISWKTFEHIHTDKTSDWYWIVGIITVSLAIIAILLNNIIFAVLIIIAAFTLALFASKKPAVIDVTISGTGIAVGKNFHSFEQLESFWVETRDAHPRILFRTKKVFLPIISVLLEDVDPDKAHAFLSRYLPEDKDIEPFFDRLLMYLGF